MIPAVSDLADQIHASHLVPWAIWKDWVTGLRAAEKYIEVEGLTRVGATGRAGNPVGGSFHRYPIAACLLQDPDLELSEQYRGFCLLLLAELIVSSSEKGTTKELETVSTELRKAASDLKSWRARLLAALPVLNLETPEQSLVALEREIKDRLINNSDENGDAAKNLLTELRRLVSANRARLSQKNRNTHQKDSIRTSDNLGELSDIGDARPATSGKVSEEPVGELKGPISEPRDSRVRLTADRSETSISRVGLLAEGRQVGGWLYRTKRRVPVDRSVLNPLERRHLSRRIHQQLRERGSQSGAYLLSLIYVTGLDLDSLLGGRLGTEGTFENGLFRRQILLPRDAYAPPDHASGAWEPPLSGVELPLPSLIGDLLPSGKGSQSLTLGDALELDQSSAEEMIATELEILRDKGRYPGMHRQRIPAQLSAILSAYERNLAIVYHIAGGAQPPSLTYYLAIQSTELVAAYGRAMARMLPAS